MKVEQLKAELVVFKGLMSNVSAAPSRLAPAEQAFLVWACGSPGHSPHPPRRAAPPPPYLFKRKGRNQSFGVGVLCRGQYGLHRSWRP